MLGQGFEALDPPYNNALPLFVENQRSRERGKLDELFAACLETMPISWCECSNGHVIKMYSMICDRDVKSEILEAVVVAEVIVFLRYR